MRARTEQAKDERRMAFLMAAIDEFYEKGFEAARVDDIAKRAGLSKGTLYLYFKNKEALFQGLVETMVMPDLAQMEQFVKDAPTATDALSMIMRFLPQMIRDSMGPRLIKIMVGEAGRFPDVVQSYKQTFSDQGLKVIAGILKRGHDTGEFVVEDIELTTLLVVSPQIMSTIYHIVFEQAGSDPLDLDELFALHERLVLKALKP